MEIPYEVKPRPDTGLWNAKIGIWLFLASEVMLFGGLFSGYVFLRLSSGADPDYHWPHGLLNVWLGFINTLVLIASSVFIVFAWVRLKLGDWNGFRKWMILVLLCSLGFLGIKSYEYYTKFTHYGVKLSDNTIVEGHHLHDEIEYSEINALTLNIKETDFRINDVAHGESDGDLTFRLKPNDEGVAELAANEYVDTAKFFDTEMIRSGLFKGKGYTLSPEEAETINTAYGVVKENLAGAFELNRSKVKEIKASVDAFRRSQMPPLERARKVEFAKFKKENPGHFSEFDDKLKARHIALSHPIRWFPQGGITTLNLEPTTKDGKTLKPFSIATKRSKLRSMAENGATLFDQTVLTGKLSAEKRVLTIEMNKIDLRSTPVPENSIIWKYAGEDAKHHFLEHRAEVIAAAAEKGKDPELDKELIVEHGGHGHEHHAIEIPYDEVKLYSNFTPKWNTYLAVYFTLTGLHGLHVLIGALVLAYFLFFGKKMFDEDPEHLANRVEVGGLFWHFVDLVWIFLFPILYLM